MGRGTPTATVRLAAAPAEFALALELYRRTERAGGTCGLLTVQLQSDGGVLVQYQGSRDPVRVQTERTTLRAWLSEMERARRATDYLGPHASCFIGQLKVNRWAVGVAVAEYRLARAERLLGFATSDDHAAFLDRARQQGLF